MSHEANPLFILREERAKGNEDFTYEDAVAAAKLRSAANAKVSPASASNGQPTSPGLWTRLTEKWNSPEIQKMLDDVVKPGQLGTGSPLAPSLEPAEMLRMGKIALAAAPYTSPAGAGRSLATTAARIFLPTMMGVKEAVSPGTASSSAQDAVGTAFNAARELAGGKISKLISTIPKLAAVLPPGMQGILAGAGEGGVTSLTGDVFEGRAPDLSEALKAGTIGAVANLLPGYFGKGGRDNAVNQRLQAVVGSPIEELDTIGQKKDYRQISESAGRFLKGTDDLAAYKSASEKYAKEKAAFDKLEAKRLAKHEAEQQAKQKAYDALAPHEKLIQAPPKREPFIPGKPPAVPKNPGPNPNITRATFKNAGFDDADRPFVETLAKDPGTAIDRVLDEMFKVSKEEGPRSAANAKFNKVVNLFENTKAKKTLQDKVGEYIFVKYLNPKTLQEGVNPIQALESLGKGADSALSRLMTPEQQKNLIDGFKATQKILNTLETANNIRWGWSGGQLWVAASSGLITVANPARIATVALSKEGAEATKMWQDLAETFERHRKNPLTGGQIPRALLNKFFDMTGGQTVDPQAVRSDKPKSGWRDLFLGR